MNIWKKFNYKNLTFLVIGLIVSWVLSKQEGFHTALLHLGGFGYAGAFIGGILFVSTFTVATGILILLILATQLTLFEVSLIAGLGAVVGDALIFRYVKNNLTKEIATIYHKSGGKNLTHIIHSSGFGWLVPIVGAIIIASPFPDEIGVGLMGISKIKTYKFLLLSFILNSIGIFLIIKALSLLSL